MEPMVGGVTDELSRRSDLIVCGTAVRASASILLERTNTFFADEGLGTGAVVKMEWCGVEVPMRMEWEAWDTCYLEEVAERPPERSPWRER